MDAAGMEWHCVAQSEDDLVLAANGMAQVSVDGRPVCLARHGGRWYAFAWKCPHASGLLSEGRLTVAGEVVCPVHGYRYSLSNGHNSSGEGYKLRVFPVEWRPGGLFVALPRFGGIGLP